ncbi:hypothetical protein [Flavobacterium yafengii]|uniref:Uncharacterized protein n=1 Tax=Flavobacterium yafengii TaxID=3041253 RepID=A0AAW6TSV0_9FLAO|nr:hypothetical protein [Flavobacterium yafengii]MDI5950272.1 hypothetical protein [Flavobacterium yafengii]
MEYINTIILLIAFLILYFLIKNMLPSYFGEKGKNLATKQDITDITEKVESVKQIFTAQNEKLKFNLQFLTSSQLGLYQEERNAIIDYNQKLAIWINVLTNSDFAGIDTKSSLEIEEYKKLISNSYSDLLESEAKFKLFVDNSELTNQADNLKILILDKLCDIANSCLIELKYNNINLERSGNDTEKLHDERMTFHDNYNKSIVENITLIAPVIREFRKNCKDYLYRLIKTTEQSH